VGEVDPKRKLLVSITEYASLACIRYREEEGGGERERKAKRRKKRSKNGGNLC
jgi:hypothetical protein